MQSNLHMCFSSELSPGQREGDFMGTPVAKMKTDASAYKSGLMTSV